MKLHRVIAMLRNYYYFSINSIDRIFDVFFWPVIDIFIWGFMTIFIAGISDFNIVSVIFGGIVLWVFVWRSSQDLVVYLLESYWSRSIYHLFITPIRNSEMVIALGVLGLIRAAISFVVLTTLSYVLYKFNILAFNFSHIVMFIGILLLFGWGLGLLVSSIIFVFGTRVQVLAWSTIWIIQPFSCVFYPLSALPSWAAKISILLPTTHIFEGMRASIKGLPMNYSSVLYAFVVSVVFLFLMAIVLTQAIKMARKKGTFAKPE